MAKLNIPTGGDEGGSKKKFVIPGGGGGGGPKGKLVVPGLAGQRPSVETAPVEVPDASEFGETEPSAGDDFLILEETPREPEVVQPVQVAAMAAPEPVEEEMVEVEPEPEPEPEPVEVKPLKISSMAPPVAEEEEEVEATYEVEEEPVYEEPVYEEPVDEEPIPVPAAGAARLVVPPVLAAATQVPQHAPPMPPPVAGYGGAAGGYGYPAHQGAVPPPGAEGHTALLQHGYQPTPQRMVPGWALMLMGVLLGMVVTILAVKFSPLGEMLLGPVMTLEDVGY